MGFKILYDSDITKFKGDVIINSVGVDTTNYGFICSSIVNTVNSPKLEEILSKVKEAYHLGEYFVTRHKNLPFTNVIHLITPYFEFDKDYKLYKAAIKNILNECNFRGWKNIGIPSLGTGANGYDKNEARKIIEEISKAYIKCVAGAHDMNITLVLPSKSISDKNDARLDHILKTEGAYHDDETIKSFKKGSSKFAKTLDTDKTVYDSKFFNFKEFANRPSITIDRDDITTIGHYIDDYIDKRLEKASNGISDQQMKNKVSIYFGYGKKTYNYTKVGSDALTTVKKSNFTSKRNFYKIILALRMNLKEAEMFLNHFGYTFASPEVNKEDDLIRWLIEERIYGLVDVEQFFENEGLESLFK